MSKYEEKLELGSVSSNVVTLRGAYHYASTDLNIILQVGTNFGHPTLNSSFTKYGFLQNTVVVGWGGGLWGEKNKNGRGGEKN